MSRAQVGRIECELLAQLHHLEHITELIHDIEIHFNEFSSALERNSIRELLRATTLIHYAITKVAGDQTAQLFCDRLQELIPAEIKTTAQRLARNELFFVWIGLIASRGVRNISVWRRANPQYQIHLWFDSHCLLASHYRRLLRDRDGLGVRTNGDLIRFQNRVYADLKSMIADGRSFDDALIRLFLRVGDGRIGRKLQSELEQAKRFYQALARHFTLRDVQDHLVVIMDDEFRHFYFREIALRANLAAASDILRLHVIEHFGGVYIDCDTLPSLDHVFVRTASYCSRHNVSFSFIDVLKSELYLQKVTPLIEFPELGDEPKDEASTRQSDMQAITDHLRKHYGEVVSLIEQDIDAFSTQDAFRPLGEIWLFNQGLRLTGDPHNRNCFNNNIIIANPHSKAIRIILLEMRHRYRYLERMGAVDIASEEEIPQGESYRARLLNYRFDALDGQHSVTVILTGPGLIFEVMMGLGYRLLNLDDQVAPISLSYALYSRKIGIAFMDQTFHTYDHSQSTWMSDPDGSALTV